MDLLTFGAIVTFIFRRKRQLRLQEELDRLNNYIFILDIQNVTKNGQKILNS